MQMMHIKFSTHMMQISSHLHLHNVLRIIGQDVGNMISFDISVYIS